jgi:hypothetical protein
VSLINQSVCDGNWQEVLALWERVANWPHFRPSATELRQQIKALILFLSNEKDWLKEQHPTESRNIEQAITDSAYIGIVVDLANTIKHRHLKSHRRTGATDTDYYGRVTTGCGATRKLHYIYLGGSKHVEIMQILRGAIDEFEEIRFRLLEGTSERLTKDNA